MTLPQLRLGGFDFTGKPELGTSAPGQHPDLGPGEGQARDAALDAEAVGELRAPLPEAPTPGEVQAGADLDDSIAKAREAAESSLQPVPLLIHDPVTGAIIDVSAVEGKP